MAANTPPKPHTEGMVFTNEETGIKYQFSGGAWRAVSSAASEEVAEAIDNIDLEKVLGNGNIADKDIVLTDGADDLIDISTTEGRIVIASDTDDKTPKLTLAHFGDHEDGNRKAEIELDENGTRLDFEMSSSVQDVHFRFGDEEKFIINHEGDAEFIGKVRIEPGTETNEAVTFGQLATLVDSQFIHPGMGLRWKYVTGSTPGLGEFAIAGNFSFRISRRDYLGRDYFRDLCATDHGSKGISTLLSVYNVSSGVYKPYEVFGVNKYRFGWSTSVMEFEYSTKIQANALVANTIYYITIGGLF